MIRTKSANFQADSAGSIPVTRSNAKGSGQKWYPGPGLVLVEVGGALEGGDDLGTFAAGQGADDGGLAVALNG
jgi:hypothetical protein